MVADRGGLHADQVVDGDIHRSDRMIRAGSQADRGTADGVELIAHAEVCAAIEEGARDEVIATGQDQGVGKGVVITIDEGREVWGRLGGEQAGLTIGEMEKLQAVGDGEIHHRNHIVIFARSDQAACGIGGTGEERDPLDSLRTREQNRVNSHRGVGIGHIENRRHAGGAALQGHEGIGAAIGGEDLHHLGFDTLGILTVVDGIDASGIGKVFQGHTGIEHGIALGVVDPQGA